MGLFRSAKTAGATSPWNPPDYNGMPVATGADIAVTEADVRRLQNDMWRFCHEDGLARFSVSFVADGASRVKLVAERFIPELGEWVQDFDAPAAAQYAAQAEWVTLLINKLRGLYSDTPQVVWNMIWHKRSVGEVYIAIEQNLLTGKITYTPYSMKSCTREKHPNDGRLGWKLCDIPGGSYDKGTARWVEEQQVRRIWHPHPDFPLLPFSGLWAGIKDLRRYQLINKLIDRAANSAMLNRGMVWVPSEAMDEKETINGREVSKFELDYYGSAKETLSSTAPDSVEAVAPLLTYWDADLGEPVLLRFGMPFNQEWMNVRSVTIEDFARAIDIPSVMVINGGAGKAGSSTGASGGGSNHWSELLVDRRTFDLTIGRDLDELCWWDLTRLFLTPQLSVDRPGAPVPVAEAELWRVGYDPTKLIVPQDRTLFGLDALRVGLISYKACLKRLGFRPDEAATAEDIKKLAELVTRSTQTLDMTRVRRGQTEGNMDGDGTSTGPMPNTASARLTREMLAEAERFLHANPAEVAVWIDA